MNANDNSDDMIDPELLKGLTEEQRQEALAAAAAAKRAEERAEQRAIARALQEKERQRRQLENRSQQAQTLAAATTSATSQSRVKFVPKRQRGEQVQAQEVLPSKPAPSSDAPTFHAPTTSTATQHESSVPKIHESSYVTQSGDVWTDKDRSSVRRTYMGKTAMPSTQAGSAEGGTEDRQRGAKGKKPIKKGLTRKSTFRFEWDNTDDTLDQSDPLYAGFAAPKRPRIASHRRSKHELDMDAHAQSKESSVVNKPLECMTPRDWRIFRENYEIVVKGGRAPPPLRTFREASLHPMLLEAIENVMRYKDPTPIQRQAIPIGLQRRDMIGIAETGSGKTAAFGVPLLQFLLSLPKDGAISKVADDGPLAVVLAPTRELALQIHGEFEKLLSLQRDLKAAAVVGGQSIQHQAQELRQGVHVVVGTPGRINDCIDMAYMVLNQCCYVVLDEADRMIDMGFAPQLESILDAMGGTLKSENEVEAYDQEEQDRMNLANCSVPKHRVTAMFSATMPPEVERMAKQYLRHPAIVSVGDQKTVKNARIVQRILFLASPSQKENALRNLISRPLSPREKVIVFVNEKKQADVVGRMIDRFGRSCVVLHGGKSQDQREENLERFRQGGIVLVATDVAGRGLDIPNVSHVINYDLPSRSIDSYNHRIGRTGRAGNEGLATSLMTDQDENIMAPLKQYLEATGQPIPDKLSRHPAANANNTQGHMIY
eukprot:Nitzschia sp. Nitz4//scaffold557_size3174//184//2325//NITZ4_009278-RA/size3174-processed-gene-0.2-mRNA-1//1//CDS//3329554449//6067//frame0